MEVTEIDCRTGRYSAKLRVTGFSNWIELGIRFRGYSTELRNLNIDTHKRKFLLSYFKNKEKLVLNNAELLF
jgi:hypothetical protein